MYCYVKVYSDAKRLFKKINNQLDAEIASIVRTAQDPEADKRPSNYNTSLDEAIKRADRFAELVALQKQASLAAARLSPALIDFQAALASSQTLKPGVLEMARKISEMMQNMQIPQYSERKVILDAVRLAYENSETYRTMRKIEEEIYPLSEKGKVCQPFEDIQNLPKLEPKAKKPEKPEKPAKDIPNNRTEK